MPIFEYNCTKCGFNFEKLHKPRLKPNQSARSVVHGRLKKSFLPFPQLGLQPQALVVPRWLKDAILTPVRCHQTLKPRTGFHKQSHLSLRNSLNNSTSLTLKEILWKNFWQR